MAIKSLEQWEKGYIAGFIDGDGAFLIRRIGKSFSFYCSIQFVGTFEQMVKVRSILGLVDSKIYQHGNRWMFLVGKQDDAESLIKRIYTFLTKKPEAGLILAMRELHDRSNSHGQNGSKPSEQILEQRLQVFKQYKTYKSRSGGHVTNWGEFEESLTDAWEASQGNLEPSILELFSKLTPDRKAGLLLAMGMDEGVTTRPEIMVSSAPPEREEIV